MYSLLRQTAAVLALIPILGSNIVQAECELRGTIVASDLPIANAQVTMTRESSEIGRVESDSDGTYRLSYPAFPERLQAAEVTVSAAGYTQDLRIFFKGANNCLSNSENNVALERAIDTPLDYSSLGLTLYIAPYQLYGEGADAIAERFNRDMPDIVYHRILSYKTVLNTPTSNFDISVDRLDEEITAAEGERIRRLGHQRNALGVIAGDGNLVSGDTDSTEIELVSVFRTIPVHGQLGLLMQPINDRLPADSASPSRLAGSMHNHWGKQAVLSYVLQRLATHEGDWSETELIRLRNILSGVRITMQRNDPLLPPLLDMLAAIDKEVQE